MVPGSRQPRIAFPYRHSRRGTTSGGRHDWFSQAKLAGTDVGGSCERTDRREGDRMHVEAAESHASRSPTRSACLERWPCYCSITMLLSTCG